MNLWAQIYSIILKFSRSIIKFLPNYLQVNNDYQDVRVNWTEEDGKHTCGFVGGNKKNEGIPPALQSSQRISRTLYCIPSHARADLAITIQPI